MAFDPIIKLLKRTGRDTRQIVDELISLDLASKNLDTRKLDKKMDDLSKSFERFARDYVETSTEWTELRSQMDILQAKLREAATDAPMLAEKIADAEMIAIQMDDLMGYAPIRLAHRIVSIQDDLIEIAIMEAKSHEGGRDKLLKLNEAIQKILDE